MSDVQVDTDALLRGVPLEASRGQAEHQVQALVLGRIEAWLIDPRGALIEEASLEWTRDGQPVTQADLPAGAVLPEALGDGGALAASELPLARYAVRPTPPGDGPRLAFAELPWVANNRELERKHLQHVRYASRPSYAAQADGGPPEGGGGIHAVLVDRGRVLRGLGCRWTRDGEPVEGLPARLPDDGVLRAEGLPWGTYAVALDDGRTRYQPVRVAWQAELRARPASQGVRLVPEATA